ncbi:hypothetical protein, partial [Algoriphagus boritolerans]|uniref:hypothetical protein n=1 Tax=Algoriphagus boritolerans TaxID=308111 RepID=UPI001F22D37C
AHNRFLYSSFSSRNFSSEFKAHQDAIRRRDTFKQNVRRSRFGYSQNIQAGDKTEGDIHFD